MVEQSIPKAFIDKIQIDEALEKFKRKKVLSFERGRHLVLMQKTYRYRCQELLKRTNGGNVA